MERAPSVPQWYWWKTGTVKTASPAGNVAEVCESFQWWAGKPLIHREGRPQVQVREGNWLQAASYTWTLPPAGGRLDAVCSESGSERTVVREHKVPRQMEVGKERRREAQFFPEWSWVVEADGFTPGWSFPMRGVLESPLLLGHPLTDNVLSHSRESCSGELPTAIHTRLHLNVWVDTQESGDVRGNHLHNWER